jgi:tetratricopeptide (TPR) repeat protein
MVRTFLLFTVKCATAAFLSLFIVGVAAHSVRSQDEPVSPTNQAIEFFNQGQDEHAKGNYAKAVELYEQATKLLPEFAEAEYQKGNAYLSLGKRQDAEGAFRRAIEIRPDWTLALAALGTALERRGEFTESEKLLTKALSLDDSSFPAYSALVEIKLKTNAPADVLKPLLEKLRSFSSKVNATAAVFAVQASIETALGEKPAAKKSLDRALSLDPNNKTALYLKAGTAISDGDLVLADELTRSLEKLDAGTESVKVLRARYLIAADKTSDAEQLLKTVATPSPETVDLLSRMSISKEQSPENLEKALATSPKDPLILGKLCSLDRVRAPDKALDYCRRALEVQPSNIDFAIGYGAALLQARRFDEAVTVLKRLNTIAPENATIRANLGTALFQLNRFAEAKTEYLWLTSHEPVPPIAYYFLGICFDQLGQYLDAGANYNLFLKYADASRNQLEIDKVKLRLPILNKQIDKTGGKQKNKSGD